MRLTIDGIILPVIDTRTPRRAAFVYGGPAALAGATTTADYVRPDPSRSRPSLRQCTCESCEMAAQRPE